MPSSDKTPNFGLNKWSGTDKPKRSDFNEDNKIIDEALRMLLAQFENISNRNLLHNWYFLLMVNQRGISGTFSILGAYFIDRWRLISGTVTLTANGLVLNGTIEQILEHAAGTNVTASVKMYSGTATASYNNAIKTFTITSNGGTIQSVKLEQGTISTLANDAPPDYGTELMKCRRHQLAVASNMRIRMSVYNSVDYLDFYMPVPVSLRITPAIAGSGVLEVRLVDTGALQSGFTFEIPVNNSNGLLIRARKANHGLTDGVLYTTGGTVLFDANL